MNVTMCALGVIQDRGNVTVNQKVVSIGAKESDFLVRHVKKARTLAESSARSTFLSSSSMPSLLETLRDTDSAAAFEAGAQTLQDNLATAMKKTSNGRDCVLAIVRVADSNGEAHVTILKLDAIVEAARIEMLNTGGVSFEVLEELLPEPGKLQKALSWPDRRAVSDVIMLDTNVTSAQYFENAYEVLVSIKSSEAEAVLLHRILEAVPPDQRAAAVAEAAPLEGTLDEVLDTLSGTYPQLADAAQEATQDPRPQGIVRRNKVAARSLIWRADGVEVRVPAERPDIVDVRQVADGWEIVIHTLSEPRLA